MGSNDRSITGITDQIGRVIWVGVRGARPGDEVLERDLDECARVGVGGVILFDVDHPTYVRKRGAGASEGAARAAAARNIESPQQTRELIQYLKQCLGERVVVCMDQEGGRVARLGPARGFPDVPGAGAYAAMDADDRAAARKALVDSLTIAGVDLNLAPCVDLAVNPASPGLGDAGRVFGRDPGMVAACAREQIDAMVGAGVGVCLKHFPGHGSASGDTHEGVVDVTGTWRDEEIEPYKELLRCAGDGVCVMAAHVMHRGIDPEVPCSVSRAAIAGLLRERVGFRGLALTDSIDMRAIAGRYGAGEAAVMAIEAGCDVVVHANNLHEDRACPAGEMHAALAEALDSGRVSEDRVTECVARLDRFAAWRAAARRGAGTQGEAVCGG